MFSGTTLDLDAFMLKEEMMIGWSQIDDAVLHRLALRRLTHGQRRTAAEHGSQVARTRTSMQYAADGGWQVSRQPCQ